jgi:hypothetical protein
MPEPIVEPAAPAAAPTPTPAATPEASPPKDNMAERAASLVNLLTKPADEPASKPKPSAAPEKSATPPAAEPKKKDKEKPIKVHKPAEPAPETRPPLPTAEKSSDQPAAAAAPAKPAAPAAPVEDEAAFEASLLEEEKAHLEDAKSAEKLFGEKYKGQSAKLRAFIKESAKKEKEIEASVKDGDMTEAEGKAAYREWYDANMPRISALDVRAIERARAKEEAVREIEPKLQEERHARWVETEAPKIEAKGAEIKADLWREALPDEVIAAANERLQGVTDPAERERITAEVKQDFALELEVTESITAAARDDIQEFYRLMATNPATGLPLKRRNRDLSTPEGQQHDRIAKMAAGICEEFKATGGAELKKDGKWFATWQEWAQMTPAQQAGWWTFNNDELIARARQNVKKVVAAAVAQQHEHLKARGFRREIPQRGKAPAAAPAAPHAGSPPAPRIAPPPAVSGGAPSSQAERLASLVGGKRE